MTSTPDSPPRNAAGVIPETALRTGEQWRVVSQYRTPATPEESAWWRSASAHDGVCRLWQGWEVLGAYGATDYSPIDIRALQVYLLRHSASGVLAGVGVEVATLNSSHGRVSYEVWDTWEPDRRRSAVREGTYAACYAPDLETFFNFAVEAVTSKRPSRRAGLAQQWALCAAILSLPIEADPMAATVQVMAGLGGYDEIADKVKDHFAS